MKLIEQHPTYPELWNEEEKGEESKRKETSLTVTQMLAQRKIEREEREKRKDSKLWRKTKKKH